MFEQLLFMFHSIWWQFVLSELNFSLKFASQMRVTHLLSLVTINLHSCWPRDHECKRSTFSINKTIWSPLSLPQ